MRLRVQLDITWCTKGCDQITENQEKSPIKEIVTGIISSELQNMWLINAKVRWLWCWSLAKEKVDILQLKILELKLKLTNECNNKWETAERISELEHKSKQYPGLNTELRTKAVCTEQSTGDIRYWVREARHTCNQNFRGTIRTN